MKTIKVAALALFVIYHPCIVMGDILFYDGFETGTLEGFDAPKVYENTTLTADNTVAKRGNYSFRAEDNSHNATGSYNYANMTKYLDITNNEEFYLRFYVYFPTGSLSALGSLRRYIVDIRSSLYYTAGLNTAITLSVVSNTFSLNSSRTYSGLTENTWYCVELKVPVCTSGGVVQWWVNGVEQASHTADYSPAVSWNFIWLGLNYVSNGDFVQHVNFDEVVIADSYIGPITVDPYPGNFQFGKAIYIAKESCGSINIPVQRMGGSSGAVSVQYATSNGTANSGSDYAAVSGTLNWSGGDTADKMISIGINNDAVKENVETVNLALGNPSGGAELGGYDKAVLSIMDDDGSSRIIPNPLISRGKSAAASSDNTNAGKAVDGVYSAGTADRWTPSTSLPQWIAINVGSGYSKLLFTWMMTADIYYMTQYSGPREYQLQVSGDSTDGSNGTWDTVANVTANYVSKRAHSLDFRGKTWVRMNITAVHGTGTWGIDEIDIHDISNGSEDTVFCWGASIVGYGFTREAGTLPGYCERIHASYPGYFPAMVNGGTGGQQGTTAVGTIDYVLQANPDMKYWFLGGDWGSNDLVYGWGTHTVFFKKALQTIFDKVRAAGHIPIITRVPYSTNPLRVDVPLMNVALDEVVQENGLTPGPDLYTWFYNHPEQLSDGTHFRDSGIIEQNRMWAEVMDGFHVTPDSGTLQLSAASYNANENGGTVTVTVTRAGGSAGAVSVQYATSNGSAAAGSDYTARSGTVNWADGDSANKTFTVAVIDDSAQESNETINLALSNITGGAVLGTPNTATITITDNDNPGMLQLSAAAYNANENGGTVTVTVTRAGGSAGAVSVQYATSNGSAAAGSDYTARSGTVNWADGDSANKTFTVAVINDTSVESSETINLVLSNVTGATLGSPASAVITITDDDNAGTLQFSAGAYSAGESSGTVTVSVSRQGGSGGAVSVQYATSNGTAVAGADYTATSGTLNWADGDSANKTFTVAVINDTSVESSETINLVLSNVTGGATPGSPSSASITLSDDDVAESTTSPKITVRHPNLIPSTQSTPVKFQLDGIVGGCDLKIYTVTGKLVRAFRVPSGTTEADWDLLNENNSNIKPGLYLYTIVDSTGNKKTGKVVISR